MTYLLNMTVSEYLCRAYLQIMLVFAAVLLVTVAVDAIIRKRNKEK